MRELWVEVEGELSKELEKILIEAENKIQVVILSTEKVTHSLKKLGIRIASREGGEITVIDEAEIDKIDSYKKPLCTKFVIKNRVDEEKAIKAAETGIDYIIVNCPNWTIIPLENLIARTQGVTKLLAEVSNSIEAKVALETLELGVDGIILKAADVNEIASTLKTILDFDGNQQRRIQLVTAKVTHCTKLSLGARACVDTCDILSVGEGMLVGCSSSGLFLVQAEVQENPHVEARPFRVNAGPISLYTLVAESKTRYLSELKAGDEVLIVNWQGVFRKVIIGRIKIERRPLILIEAEVNGDKVKTIVQNAETIRFVTSKGSKSVVEIKEGDELLVQHQQGGRHFGTLVEEETAIER